MYNSKIIIGYINVTIRGYRVAFGIANTPETIAHKIIRAIVEDLPFKDSKTQEILAYCKEHYNFNL